ncbi:hypothetical protein CEF21_00650 [Bacillus sp. FJAT-42376]|uniref:hypothetical protein n=1 Tax=Bacillus sp. FJAT-42376 TaxID=2014076 RepID=UPI000F50CC7E|nr:hypothetical protein [Bacillus sp. FJAT-42376]AZB40972.1 hypothetical protein CEF21_00650 [Bacillus sp. FJAT-42376]
MNRDIMTLNEEKAGDPLDIQTLYDEIYDRLEKDHNQVMGTLQQNGLNEEEKEKAERMELALQTAKDIFENIMTPGTSMKIVHSKGSLTIEIND